MLDSRARRVWLVGALLASVLVASCGTNPPRQVADAGQAPTSSSASTLDDPSSGDITSAEVERPTTTIRSGNRASRSTTSTTSTSTTTTSPPPTLAEPLAGLTYESLAGGRAGLDALAGRPIVVNFFAAWCPPCRAEMPQLQAAHERWGGQVTFLGIDANEARSTVERFVADTGASYPIGIDTTGEMRVAFDGSVIPTTAFIAADGTLVDVHAGYIDAEELDERVAALLP